MNNRKIVITGVLCEIEGFKDMLVHAKLNYQTVQTPDQLMYLLDLNIVDLIVLDVTQLSAFDHTHLSAIRRVSEVPVITLLDHHDQMDIVQNLSGGADDVMSMPLNTDLLVARIRALLRRVKNDRNAFA